jgi:hypothetical protein
VFLGTEYVLVGVARAILSTLNDFTADKHIFFRPITAIRFPLTITNRDGEKRENGDLHFGTILTVFQ